MTRIPPEILAYIFELYVARFGELTLDGVNPRGPFFLTQVCTLWKAVAESDPNLWTTIHFYFPESHTDRDDDVPRVEPLLDIHLQRSGALPISFTFIDCRAYDLRTNDLITSLVDRLRTHAQRWKSISLQLSCGYFHLLYKFTPCDLPTLEHFCMNGDDRVGWGHRNRLCLDLDSATNLKSFAYGTTELQEDYINLRWENLTEVSFAFSSRVQGAGRTLYHQMRHLAKCQNITTCSLGIEDGIRPRLDSIQTITLPCLHTLRVRRLSQAPDAYADSVINPLVLPQLHTLELDASNLVITDQQWHNHTFPDLLARSGCSLLHLSIQDIDFPNDDVIRCLELSPALMSLCFIPCPRSQEIIDVIQRLDSGHTSAGGRSRSRRSRAVFGPLVPQLREIALGSSVKEYLDSMLAMFHSRAGTTARAAGVALLRRAEVVFFDLWHDRDAQQSLGCVPGDRLERVATFRTQLAQWVSENGNEKGQESGDEDRLEGLVAVDSLYLPEYIDVQYGSHQISPRLITRLLEPIC